MFDAKEKLRNNKFLSFVLLVKEKRRLKMRKVGRIDKPGDTDMYNLYQIGFWPWRSETKGYFSGLGVFCASSNISFGEIIIVSLKLL